MQQSRKKDRRTGEDAEERAWDKNGRERLEREREEK
jgi:hypothetical protein